LRKRTTGTTPTTQYKNTKKKEGGERRKRTIQPKQGKTTGKPHDLHSNKQQDSKMSLQPKREIRMKQTEQERKQKRLKIVGNGKANKYIPGTTTPKKEQSKKTVKA